MEARRNTLEAGGRGIQFKNSVADVVPHTLVLNLPCDGGGCESKSTDLRGGVVLCLSVTVSVRAPTWSVFSMRFAVTCITNSRE